MDKDGADGMKIKETMKDTIQLGPLTLLGYNKTIRECPKCGSKLNQRADMSQLYACPKCGYRGPIGLNPEKKKAGRKKS